MFGRKSALWLAAAIGVLAILVPASASALSGPNACNGAIELCEKPFNEVVLPGTHNSMSSEEYDWSIPNQHHSIPTQLQMGVRGLLIDTHYGKPVPGAGVSGVAPWNNGTDGNPTGVANTYLCHSSCYMGASGLADELAKVTSFLSTNPREVLIFVVQNGIAPQDYATAVEESGLIDFVYTGPTETFPTLEQMIASNQRVVMLSEGNTGSVPWFHNGYAGPMQETPYNFLHTEAEVLLTPSEGMKLLTESTNLDSSCRPFRGGVTGGLFLMNHWVNGEIDSNLKGAGNVIPDSRVAETVNRPEILVNRARACAQRRGLLPTVIAVDHFGTGDLLAAVDELNGITPDPDPDPDPKGMIVRIKTAKTVRAKAGKTAIFKVTLSNVGDTAGPAKVCAKVPGRLGKKPKCLTRNVKPGAKVTLKFKVKTKPKAKGKAKVKFTATAGGKSANASSTLIVKPRKRR